MVNWVCQMTDAELETFQYRLSDPKKEVPLMTFESSSKATRPIQNYYEKKLYGEAYEHID